MKRKLVIAMIVIGGALTTLQAVMLGVYLHSQDALAVETQEQANRTAEETNAELQAQYDKAVELREKGIVETAFETPSLQKDFDAGKLDEAALQAKMSPVVDITWIFRNSWIVTTAIITLFTFLALFVAAAVLWFRDDSLPITWAEGLTYAGALFWFLIVINGMIPDLIIKIWDNVFKIKGIFTVPLTEPIAQRAGQQRCGRVAVGLVRGARPARRGLVRRDADRHLRGLVLGAGAHEAQRRDRRTCTAADITLRAPCALGGQVTKAVIPWQR